MTTHYGVCAMPRHVKALHWNCSQFYPMALAGLCEFRDVRFVHTKLHFRFGHVSTMALLARRTSTIQLHERQGARNCRCCCRFQQHYSRYALYPHRHRPSPTSYNINIFRAANAELHTLPHQLMLSKSQHHVFTVRSVHQMPFHGKCWLSLPPSPSSPSSPSFYVCVSKAKVCAQCDTAFMK